MNFGTISNLQEPFIGQPVPHPISYLRPNLDTTFLYEVTMSVVWNLDDQSDKSLMNLEVNGNLVIQGLRLNQSENGLLEYTQIKSIVPPLPNGDIEMVGYFGTENGGMEMLIENIVYTIKRIEF